MASFGFSAGDFITCLSLAQQISQALRDSTGSVADYKSFLQTLNSLNLTFTTSELIYLQWQNDVGDPKYSRNAQAMVNGMLFERQQCKILMERFLKTSEPYSDAFLKRRENAVVRGWRKVTWLYQKEEISKLERNLQGHMRAMQIYADALFQNQMARHTEVVDSQFQRLFSSVVDMRTDISAMSKSIQASTSRLPQNLGYPWEACSSFAENVLLLDANGRSLLLPMLFLSSPQQFHELLKLIYRGIPGHRRILRKEYTITNEDSDGTMVQESNWNNVIRAGIQLSLNIILQTSSSWKKHHCPRCDEPTLGHTLPGKRRRCHKCQLTYRLFEHERIVEGNTVVASASETVNTTSAKENASEAPETEGRYGKKRKDELFIREEFYFKHVHYHREIQVIKINPTPTPTVDVEPQQLKVEDLPPLHRAAANGFPVEIGVLLDSREMVDSPLPFNVMLDKPLGGRQEFRGCSPLHIAAYFGRAKAIESLLDRGGDIYAKDWLGAQPLHYTLTGENYGVAMLLMARGADVNATNNDGDSFLHRVCEMGITWLLSPALEYGGELSFQDRGGSNALHLAANHGREELVETILGIDIATCITALDNSGQTPIFDAAKNGSVKIAAALLEHGANASLPDPTGWTPLHVASYNGNYEVARLLLEHGCSVSVQDEEGYSPLHDACCDGRSERIVRLLHESGADIGMQNANGSTPLHIASRLGKIPIMKTLFEAGAVKLLETEDNARVTPLLRACWGNTLTNNTEAIKLLLSHGANVKIQDEDGETPLHFMAWAGNSELSTIMLENGADVDAQTNGGETPLFYASQHNYVEVVEILLKHGASVNSQGKDGDTPLHWASNLGHDVVAKALLKHGASVNSQNKDGDTPLHYASYKGHEVMATELLKYGASVNSQDKQGCTPLHWASYKGHEVVAKELLKYGADAMATTNMGDTPLHLASMYGHLAVVKHLLEHRGSDINAGSSVCEIPFRNACVSGHDFETKLIVDGTDYVNTQRADGATALNIACWKFSDQSLQVVEYLLENGSDPFTKDGSGRTPLDVAERSEEMHEIAALLRKRTSQS